MLNTLYIMVGLNIFCLLMVVLMLMLINKQNYLNAKRLKDMQDTIGEIFYVGRHTHSMIEDEYLKREGY